MVAVKIGATTFESILKICNKNKIIICSTTLAQQVYVYMEDFSDVYCKIVYDCENWKQL